jgi:hypothetical protein
MIRILVSACLLLSGPLAYGQTAPAALRKGKLSALGDDVGRLVTLGVREGNLHLDWQRADDSGKTRQQLIEEAKAELMRQGMPEKAAAEEAARPRPERAFLNLQRAGGVQRHRRERQRQAPGNALYRPGTLRATANRRPSRHPQSQGRAASPYPPGSQR